MTTESTRDVAPPVRPCAGTSRRAVLAGAGAVCAVAVLGGCATYDATSGGNPPPAGPGGGGDPVAAGPFAQTSDIPVGSATIFADRQVVVSQPEAGTFKAFTAVCTHQGCIVSDVKEGIIICNCHGSQFNAADGSVAGGPAGRPLREVGIVVEGTGIKLA